MPRFLVLPFLMAEALGSCPEAPEEKKEEAAQGTAIRLHFDVPMRRHR